MKVIAIEEHFITPMYREKVGANEFRNFYLFGRDRQRLACQRREVSRRHRPRHRARAA